MLQSDTHDKIIKGTHYKLSKLIIIDYVFLPDFNSEELKNFQVLQLMKSISRA